MRTSQRLATKTRMVYSEEKDDRSEYEIFDGNPRTLDRKLHVKQSSLGETAGKGLFATTKYETGDYIVEYAGKVIKNDGHTGPYVLTLRDGFVVDGKDKIDLGPYANDPIAKSKVNARYYVTDIQQHELLPLPQNTGATIHYRAWLIAIKPIQPGDEIFCSYGKKYWEQMKIEPVSL